MKVVYIDEYCRVLLYDGLTNGGKEFKLVAFDSDLLPPHWPNKAAMFKSYREIAKLDLRGIK